MATMSAVAGFAPVASSPRAFHRRAGRRPNLPHAAAAASREPPSSPPDGKSMTDPEKSNNVVGRESSAATLAVEEVRAWCIRTDGGVLATEADVASLRAAVDQDALLLWSGTWVLTAVWVILFDNQRQLVLAALVLLAAFGTSLAALFVQQAWPSHSGEQILLFAPLSLLSGWLLVASSVGLGTALTCDPPAFGEIKAENEVSLRVWEDATRDAIFARQKEATTTQNVVVVVLALVGACLTLFLPDPLFVWPIVWAVLLQRGFPRSIWFWLALAILVAGCAVSVVRVFVWQF